MHLRGGSGRLHVGTTVPCRSPTSSRARRSKAAERLHGPASRRRPQPLAADQLGAGGAQHQRAATVDAPLLPRP